MAEKVFCDANNVGIEKARYNTDSVRTSQQIVSAHISMNGWYAIAVKNATSKDRASSSGDR